jgi:hypothetical protein
MQLNQRDVGNNSEIRRFSGPERARQTRFRRAEALPNPETAWR